jgi:SPP1 gp7 family putative phage head morphogenesis protein
MRRSRAAGTQAAAAVADDDPDQLGDGDDLDDEDRGDDADTAAAYTVTASALRGTAQAIARALLAATLAGAGVQAVQAAVDTVLADATAWTSAVRTAAAAAFNGGMTRTYQARGVEQVDYVTAGDGRVCPACESAEDGSPYPAATVPQPPLHPNCRCTVQPT